MGKIIKLDPITINKIAAGEVIERPASVAKELIENAIDAGAAQILVEVEDGGKKSIKVADNGQGMERNDVKLAFEKHSTSKLSKIEDLQVIRTMGFRGEALSSIASIARVELLSRTKDEEVGTKAAVEGGKIMSVKDAGCPVGTSVTVKDVFFNIPARKKHLKKTRTELAHIIDVVTRNALVHPEIDFRLLHNGEELFKAPGTKDMLENIVHIYGREVAKDMLEIVQGEEGEKITISGYIGKPNVYRSDAAHISVFVNKRFVRSKLVNGALRDGYHGLLMKNRFPVAVLSLDIDPKKIDINVHPTKSQIRFLDEIEVYNAIIEAVNDTLSSAKLISKPRKAEFKIPDITGKRREEKVVRPELKDRPEIIPGKVKGRQSFLETGKWGKERKIIERLGEGRETEDKTSETDETPPTESPLPHIIPTGQILDTYILAQSGDDLVIIDQHAAHERVVFEQLKEKYGDKGIETQELLIPLSIDFTPKESQLLSSYVDLLNELGFVIEPFGKNTWNVRAVPVVLGKLEGEDRVRELLSELMETGKTKGHKLLRERILHLIACHSAIRAGETLTEVRIGKLIKEMGSIKNPYSCPHGRPTIIHLTKKELEKMFGRTG